MNYPRLSKSGIEYLDYQWGIFSGCHNHLVGICDGGGQAFNCWAQSIVCRFASHYPDGFEPHYYPEAINSPKHLKKPSTIGVGWVGDVIGYGLEYKEQIYSTIEECPQHTFWFLTKNAGSLSQWSPFPLNCSVGVTVCGDGHMTTALTELATIKARIKYLSIEPLLGAISMKSHQIKGIADLLIIGAQTHPAVMPRIEWLKEIVEAADKAGIQVFLKDNLEPLFKPLMKVPNMDWWGNVFGLRQELPGEAKA